MSHATYHLAAQALEHCSLIHRFGVWDQSRCHHRVVVSRPRSWKKGPRHCQKELQQCHLQSCCSSSRAAFISVIPAACSFLVPTISWDSRKNEFLWSSDQGSAWPVSCHSRCRDVTCRLDSETGGVVVALLPQSSLCWGNKGSLIGEDGLLAYPGGLFWTLELAFLFF